MAVERPSNRSGFIDVTTTLSHDKTTFATGLIKAQQNMTALLGNRCSTRFGQKKKVYLRKWRYTVNIKRVYSMGIARRAKAHQSWPPIVL